MHPVEGQKAPEFNLPDQDGKMHSLAEHRGEWVLLYFYPKDDTPGCIKQACGIRDSLPDFGKLSCTVYGISADSVKSHRAFADKYGLLFTLLADEEKKTIDAYDVWRMKNKFGREFFGIVRTSFLIDPEGKIAKVYEHVVPAEHAAMVLHDLTELQKKQ